MKNKIQNLFYVCTLLLFTGGLFSFSSNENNPATASEFNGEIYLTFAGKHAGKITQGDLNRTYEVGIDGCARDLNIFQFELKITKDGKTTSHEGNSSRLTQAMLSDLRSLSKGDEFIFKQIKAYFPDGKSEVGVKSEKFTVV